MSQGFTNVIKPYFPHSPCSTFTWHEDSYSRETDEKVGRFDSNHRTRTHWDCPVGAYWVRHSEVAPSGVPGPNPTHSTTHPSPPPLIESGKSLEREGVLFLFTFRKGIHQTRSEMSSEDPPDPSRTFHVSSFETLHLCRGLTWYLLKWLNRFTVLNGRDSKSKGSIFHRCCD